MEKIENSRNLDLIEDDDFSSSSSSQNSYASGKPKEFLQFGTKQKSNLKSQKPSPQSLNRSLDEIASADLEERKFERHFEVHLFRTKFIVGNLNKH
mgnify:CR=1 FL=1